jgi:hypothetical protein
MLGLGFISFEKAFRLSYASKYASGALEKLRFARSPNIVKNSEISRSNSGKTDNSAKNVNDSN